MASQIQETCRREPNESVAAVGDDIRQMAQKAYCNLDSLAQEDLALNQLYKIMSLEMKCRCLDRDCRTVAEAVDIIEGYEAIMGDYSDCKKSNMRTIDSSPLRKAESQSKLNLESTLERIEARLDRLEKQMQFQLKNMSKYTGNAQNWVKRTYYTCSSPYHLFKNCPYNNQSHYYQTNAPPRQITDNSMSVPNQGNGNQLSL